MKEAVNLTLDHERALYGECDLLVKGCRFEGPLDGESALKEAKHVKVESSYFSLRYPFWHDTDVTLSGSTLTETCRAAFWYCDCIRVEDSRLHGIKAMRECKGVSVSESDIISAEFGWFCSDVALHNSSVEGEYLFLRTEGLTLDNVKQKGKYSFQYVKDATIRDSYLDTKDAFWHAERVTVINSVVKGEYLGWYSKDLTLINCKIIGTQPLCYASGLKLVDCEMIDCDLSFERSEVEATLTAHIDSIKNPIKGSISVPSVGEIIRDIDGADADIIIDGKPQ